jgi:hypothetical protein
MRAPDAADPVRAKLGSGLDNNGEPRAHGHYDPSRISQI